MGRPLGSKNKPKSEGDTQVLEPETAKAKKPDDKNAYKKGDRWYSQDHYAYCMGCGHLESKHHGWRYYKVEVRVRNFLTGGWMDESRDAKDPVDIGKGECQHACSCKAYV